MSKYHKISQTCFYFGVLMALIAMDWHWYAGKFPDSSFVLKWSFLPVIYVAFLLLMAVLLVCGIVFGLKARPKHTGHTIGKGKR